MRKEMLVLKRWYLAFINKQRFSFFESILYAGLLLLSLIYTALVLARNFCYDKKIAKTFKSSAFIISVGNISWGGTGKTSLVILLYEHLALQYKTAVVTKGYARDEYHLLAQRLNNVYDNKDRVEVVRKIQHQYAVVLLDDCFQYRRLHRNCDIVMMNARELFQRKFLIPATSFREPLSSLARADIIIITHWRGVETKQTIRSLINNITRNKSVYFAEYHNYQLVNLNNEVVDRAGFADKRIGLLTGIGYPGGFRSGIEKSGFTIEHAIVYPDHYQFSSTDLARIERQFSEKGIDTILISRKDFYHIDFCSCKLDYFIADAQLHIEERDRFMKDVLSQFN